MTTVTILADNGVSSGTSGLKTSGGNDGTLALQTTNSAGTALTGLTIDNNQNVALNNGLNTPNTFGFKNRLMNGAMVIDQRNCGTSVTANTATFGADRWKYDMVSSSKGTTQTTPSATETGYATRVAAGFQYYLAFTSSAATSVGSTDYYSIIQTIEGNNVADLAWGTSSAKTVTLSFLAYSSLTGTFGGSIQNSGYNRSYPFSYSIPTANTWTQISITIPGDQSGTWLGANNAGIRVRLSLGTGSTYSGTANAWVAGDIETVSGAVNVVSTSGATFYVTGVQFEKGSVATSFDWRAYPTELALCQRYYFTTYPASFAVGSVTFSNARTAYCLDTGSTGRSWPLNGSYAVPMRVSPTTVSIYDPQTGASGYVREYSSGIQKGVSNVDSGGSNGTQGIFGYMLLSTNETALQPVQFHIGASAEF